MDRQDLLRRKIDIDAEINKQQKAILKQKEAIAKKEATLRRLEEQRREIIDAMDPGGTSEAPPVGSRSSTTVIRIHRRWD
uniref:PKcGMP_CC domain-containing protein n=1 Tax=Steinernema glaseri TaxID=37863 RepID=A0A1I7YNF5_9BILA